jgi:hypothetical protein
VRAPQVLICEIEVLQFGSVELRLCQTATRIPARILSSNHDPKDNDHSSLRIAPRELF